jgi:hypothetical protein
MLSLAQRFGARWPIAMGSMIQRAAGVANIFSPACRLASPRPSLCRLQYTFTQLILDFAKIEK